MNIWMWLQNWLGLNPALPYTWEVEDPVHGQKARNKRGQKVIFDENVDNWVMPQNFSDKPPVTITRNK